MEQQGTNKGQQGPNMGQQGPNMGQQGPDMRQREPEMSPLERFLDKLAEGIIFAGGTARFGPENARTLSREVWQELKEIGSDAYPVIVQRDDVRFVYQWDQEPSLLTVMTWDERMWRDMVRLEVPTGLDD